MKSDNIWDVRNVYGLAFHPGPLLPPRDWWLPYLEQISIKKTGCCVWKFSLKEWKWKIQFNNGTTRIDKKKIKKQQNSKDWICEGPVLTIAWQARPNLQQDVNAPWSLNLFLLLAQSANLELCCTKHFHRWHGKDFSPRNPVPRPGIELMSPQLHLFEGPSFRTLYWLSYNSRDTVMKPVWVCSCRQKLNGIPKTMSIILASIQNNKRQTFFHSLSFFAGA